MTWSNVGNGPGSVKEGGIKVNNAKTPKGAMVHALGGLKPVAGHQRPEPPTERQERLRRIARGGR